MSPIKIGWKVSSLSYSLTSLRYRALLPILALESERISSRLFSSSKESNLDGLNVLVIVKSATPDDLFLAQRAALKGVRVILDLCDNIFIDGYRPENSKISPSQIVIAIAEYTDTIVVASEPLKAVVRRLLPSVRVLVIPNGIDSPNLHDSMKALLSAAEVREKRARIGAYCKLLTYPLSFPSGLLRHSLNRLQWHFREKLANWIVSITSASHPNKPKFTYDRALTYCQKATADRAVENLPGHAKTILWFGSHGAEYAQFGLRDLLMLRSELETVAREFDVELVVVSNCRRKYDELIRTLHIPSRYVEWSTEAVNSWLGKSDVVVVPNSLDQFSRCKSANRSVLAVSQDVPVVATPTAALNPLAPHIHIGDVLTGLRRYLRDREAGRRDARAAYAAALSAFGQKTLAKEWQSALSRPWTAQRQAGSPAQCIVVLNLVQDLDLAEPILKTMTSERISVHVCCSRTLFNKTPRLFNSLRTHNFPYTILPDDFSTGDYKFPDGAQVMLTIAETNLGPHRFARRLSQEAKDKGLAVATLQHGFENVGLTYEDSLHPIHFVSIAAQRIYIWGGLETLHPKLHTDVRKRCLPVGCPKPAEVRHANLQHLLPSNRLIVGVFENLHWHRYDSAYRECFLNSLAEVAQQFPQVTFVVKPHQAGLWLTRYNSGKRLSAQNISIIDPESEGWEPYTASSLMPYIIAAITTPSTVALDAARIQVPVAVVANALNLENYQPLPLLLNASDWGKFIKQALDPLERGLLRERATCFVNRVIRPGDATRRIVDDLRKLARA